MDEEELEPLETDDGWVIDICCQCQTEFNSEALALDDAWQDFYEELCEAER